MPGGDGWWRVFQLHRLRAQTQIQKAVIGETRHSTGWLASIGTIRCGPVTLSSYTIPWDTTRLARLATHGPG